MFPLEMFYLYERNYKIVENEIENDQYDVWFEELKPYGISNICEKYRVSENVLKNGSYSAGSSYNAKLVYLCDELNNIFFDEIELPKEYNSKGDMLFSSYFTPLIKVGMYKLRKKSNHIEKEVEMDFIESLFSKLASCSVRTLIFEMHICKQSNELKGSDAKEEYQYYNNHILVKEEYRKKFFQEYPVLWRIVLETIECSVNNYSCLIKRIHNDHQIIVSRLCDGNDFVFVRKIKGQMSDAHNGGKTVFQITLDNDYKILYKPHPVLNEIKYQELYCWSAKISGISAYNYKIVDRKQYGWIEFVEYLECQNNEEVQRYYYRIGLQAFIMYILGAGDIHYENMIVHGEHPVIVDCETILENMDEVKKESAYNLVSRYINSSVLHLGIFPYYTWENRESGVDFSALGNSDEQTVPVLMPKIVSEKTSDMKIIYEYPTVKGKENIVKFNCENINPADFRSHIIAGFTDIYKYVMVHKDEFKKVICSLKIKNITVRQLMQNTQKYSLLLSASYHPIALHDGAVREFLLSKVLKDIDAHDKRKKFIANAEISEMLMNDIPYFFSKADSRDLFSTSGMTINDFYDCTALERLEERINRLSQKDLMFQAEFINDTLMPTNQEQKKAEHGQLRLERCNNKQIKLKGKELLRCIDVIAENISNTAFYNNNTVSWIAASRDGINNKIHWRFFPIGHFLYDGLAGITLFFAMKKKVNRNSAQDDYLLDAAVRSLFDYTDYYAKENIDKGWTEIGAFSGESSMAYSYLLLYKMLNQKIYLNYALKHILLLKKRVTTDNRFDLLCGNAGLIHVLCQLHDVTKEEDLLVMAHDAARQLLDKAVTQEYGVGWTNQEFPDALAGFAHGNAGIAYALMELWNKTKNPQYLEVVTKSLDFEDSLFDVYDDNWIDKRSADGVRNEEKGIRPIAWCHGAGGILLSRLEMLKVSPTNLKDRLMRDIEKAASTVIRGGVFTDYCLCHGTLGNMLILNEYNKVFKSRPLGSALNRVVNRISIEIADGNYVSQQNNSPFFNGLMLGSAGMGYAILKILYPELPNILSLKL